VAKGQDFRMRSFDEFAHYDQDLIERCVHLIVIGCWKPKGGWPRVEILEVDPGAGDLFDKHVAILKRLHAVQDIVQELFMLFYHLFTEMLNFGS
jgi:hypothetical protein